MHALLPTLLVVAFVDAVAGILLIALSKTTAAKLAWLSCFLMLVTLFFTNWGFSMPEPKVDIFWGGAVMACVSQLALFGSMLPSRKQLDASKK